MDCLRCMVKNGCLSNSEPSGILKDTFGALLGNGLADCVLKFQDLVLEAADTFLCEIQDSPKSKNEACQRI